LVAKVSSVLPRIGSKLALRVAEEFESVEEMIAADAKRWTNVEGIGLKTAEHLVHVIRSRRPKSG
jgi:ERCC4-type nuclease